MVYGYAGPLHAVGIVFECLLETFYRHALDYRQSARSETKCVCFVLPYGNAWPLLTFLRPEVGGLDTVSALAPDLGLETI